MVGRPSEVHSSNPVRVLAPCQVWDVSRDAYFVHLESTPRRHRGRPVYKDGFGQRIVIAD